MKLNLSDLLQIVCKKNPENGAEIEFSKTWVCDPDQKILEWWRKMTCLKNSKS